MSVFKKLVGFLFEEEEEIEEEGELEEVSIHDYRTKAYQEEPIQAKHAPMQEQVRVEEIRTQGNPVPMQNVQAQPPKKETKFTTIELSKEEKTPQNQQRVHERIQQRGMKRSEPTKTEFEFTPVISPIFGMDETEEPKHVQPNASVPQMRTTISRAPKKNPLGTILSPMYGATELEEFEEEAKGRLERNEAIADPMELQQPPIQSIHEVLAYDDSAEEDDIVKVPLEDLLSSEDQSEQSEDLLQFSLFGDDEIVSMDKNEASYTIKE